MKGWIGVDLDGTLAEYTEWQGPEHIGAPIPVMVERVKRWLADGHDVRIFTARVSAPYPERDIAEQAIASWCRANIGTLLPVTCIKDLHMAELWDDRAVTVERNTGNPLAPSTRGLE